MSSNQREILPPMQDGVQLELIGQGTGTKVYRCIVEGKSADDARIVLKSVQHNCGCHLKACENLRAEYQRLQRYQHPNIVRAYQFDCLSSDEGVEFCAMQVENCRTDLFKQMKEDFPSVKHRQLRRWFQQTTQALYYLHSEHHTGHFDVKPENIAISKRGNAKLIDFGFSYAYENANQNQLEKLWRNRSKLYIAPELLQVCDAIESNGVQKVDFKTIPNWEKVDVFALALSFFCAYFYKSPLDGNRADSTDPFFQHVYRDDFEGFWMCDEQVRTIVRQLAQHPETGVQQLVDLLWKMMAYDSAKRLTLKEVLEHPFFKDLQ